MNRIIKRGIAVAAVLVVPVVGAASAASAETGPAPVVGETVYVPVGVQTPIALNVPSGCTGPEATSSILGGTATLSKDGTAVAAADADSTIGELLNGNFMNYTDWGYDASNGGTLTVEPVAAAAGHSYTLSGTFTGSGCSIAGDDASLTIHVVSSCPAVTAATVRDESVDLKVGESLDWYASSDVTNWGSADPDSMPSYDNPAGDARPGAKVADDFEVSGEFTFTPTADEVGEDVTLTWNVTTQTAGTCVGQDPTAKSANATLTVHVVAADSTSQPSTTPSASPSASATPAAPADSALTASVQKTGLASSVLTIGTSTTLTVGTQFAGQQVDVWLHSDPIYLGRFTVAADGTVKVTLPASVPAGEHKVIVANQAGTVLAWDAVTVSAASNTVPGGATGLDEGSSTPWLPATLAGLVVLAAAGITARRLARR